MDQLEEAVLGVGARLSPDHSTGGVVDRDAVAGDPFAVALRVQLLQEGRKMLEVLVVGITAWRRPRRNCCTRCRAAPG